ncbi:MAG: prolyl-tRNA synthetase associated domain-containing protein [Alphaproteobacteria bacterium]
MPATTQDLLSRLEKLGFSVSTAQHPPVHTVEQARALRGEIAGGHCKNLFLKDKKKALWLVVALEDTIVDLKTLHKRIGAARLSFGKAELLLSVLGVTPGSVTPFALINDVKAQVNVVLDQAMMAHACLNYHPLVNTATTTIDTKDLLTFIQDCGHRPQILPLTAPQV